MPAPLRGGGELVCQLPNDPWMQNMLRPIVESAGYRVVGEADLVEADLVIVQEGAKVAKGAAGRTIRLRSQPEAAGAKDSSIYRYDRAALLVALKSAGGGRDDDELLLVVTIAGERWRVCRCGGVGGRAGYADTVPRAAAHVAGLSALRSRC